MSKKRNWMKIPIQNIEFPLPSGFECTQIALSHADILGDLMDASYRGTIDYDGETLEQCVQEMVDTINGKYGPFVKEASFFVSFNKKPVSAILITEWKEQPLVAYTMTDNVFRGQGLAKFLLGKSISSSALSKWKQLFLVVTEGNASAEKLYEKAGFKYAGQALPGTPPPLEG